jgi:hypothetical protein
MLTTEAERTTDEPRLTRNDTSIDLCARADGIGYRVKVMALF